MTVMEDKNTELKEEEREEEVVENAAQEPVTEEDDEESAETAVSAEEYEVLQEERDKLQDQLLRLQAEYDNFRKRTTKEKQADLKYKSQAIVTELLPVIDNFERGLQVDIEGEAAKGIVEGMEMIYRQLKKVLEDEGVKEIPTNGEQFDPNVHQAVMQVEEDGYESNEIVETLQKGYQLKDKVIRPAMVKVNQ